MRAKKYKGKVYGAQMTSAERKAMDMEIQRQLAEYDKKHLCEVDAVVLWILHEEFGFGKKRLKRFFNTFERAVDDLLERYSMDDKDAIWLCTFKLKQYGIDIEKWHNESQ